MAESHLNERLPADEGLTAPLLAPLVEIAGGHPFFLPQANEAPIRGPVFPRGRGPGPGFRITTGCAGEVAAWIGGPRGGRIANLAVVPLPDGRYEARWDWASLSGWPVPEGIQVGEYRVHVSSTCQEGVTVLPFYVVFDPLAVGGPARFSFDRTAIWFGTGVNVARGLHYYLHCSDWRVFQIAIQAAAGQTDPYVAAVAVARAEESLFGYSLNYQTNDLLDLLLNYSEAQCADDAACLTAFLRAVGIPAHPVTADAALETGDADWTFDTWVEFLAERGGATDWRILHPHEYPGMLPESRSVFGRRGVANKGFNDLIIMANDTWADGPLDDGAVNVAYGRNECGEPVQTVSKAAWVDELCESGYWPQAHWECPEGGLRRLVAGLGLRLSGGALAYGGRLAGTVDLRNPTGERQFGQLVLQLVVCRLESKAFVEQVLYSVAFPVAVDPAGSVALPFDCALPATLAPGRELHVRALFNDRTALIMPVRLPQLLAGRADMPAVWQQGGEQTLRVHLHNTGGLALHAIEVKVDATYALSVDRPGPERIDVLAPGETREIAFAIRAIAALSSGSLHVAVASADGGGLMLRQPFRVGE